MIESGIQALIAPVVLSCASLVLMMQIAFYRNAFVSWLISSASLVLAMLALIPQILLGDFESQQITPLLIADKYSVFFSLLILFASLITTLLAKDYLRFRSGENEEFYLLVLLSTLGALVLASSTHLASFLLGLELLGVALYALIAYPERGRLPLEAAIKYLVLSGAASAILLFGFALIYAALGTLSFAGIGEQLAGQNTQTGHNALILMGTAMVFTGIGFKLSLVPFHMWTPDVYQGAPSPVTGFLATVSKGAIFCALIRLFVDAELYQYSSLITAIAVIAIASMIIGNLLALKQNNLKRLLAYSSIAHLGYLLISLAVFSSLQQANIAVEAASFYVAAYIVTSIAAFALVSILSSQNNNKDAPEADDIQQIEGLFWRQPLLALMLTIAILSLAGIPLTAGFIGKFYLFTIGIKGSLWILIGALVIGSGIGIYYYLRIVFAMTIKQQNTGHTEQAMSRLSYTAKSVIWLLIIMILYLGVLPESVMNYISGISL